MHTTKGLEYIANELASRGLPLDEIAKQIHQAGLLATLEGVSRVLGSRAAPTPLFRIAYNPQANSLDFTFLEGRGKVPAEGAVDIEVSDMVLASMLSDRAPLLFEGITGTGKTYTLEQIMKSVYDGDNRKGLRLNAQMSNVLQPYISARMQDGALIININREAAQQVACLFVDEKNRGDTNAVIGLLDGQVTLPTGESAELGLPIPQLTLQGSETSAHFSEGRIKPVVVYAAQNPASVEYSGARATDSAVENRLVRVSYPNMALNSGAATLNMNGRRGHHEEFLEAYLEKMSVSLGLNPGAVSAIFLPQSNTAEERKRANQEYLALHAYSFDPQNIQKSFLMSAVEGSDHIIMLMGGEGLAKNFEFEQETAKEWSTALSSYNVDFQYPATLDPTSEVMKRIDAVRAACKEPLIERDKKKATKIAESLALITQWKQSYRTSLEKGTSPLEEFVALESPLTLRDIASAYTIALHDKIPSKNGASPVGVINQAFNDYISLFQGLARVVYGKETPFNLQDPNMSVRYIASYFAVNAVKEFDSQPSQEYANAMIQEINRVAALLRGLDGGMDTKKLLISRINADLASLAGFLHEYQRDIAASFNNISASNKVLPRYRALAEILTEARGHVTNNYTLPRVARVFGI